MPRSNSPELKYNTLKPRRRKQQHRHSQFYSLRLCRKHEASAVVNRNFQLYAIPIYKSCPHKNGSTSTIATSIRSNECTPTSTLTRSSRETIKSEIIKTETIKKTETIESTSSSSSSTTLHSNNSQRIHSNSNSKRNNKINFTPQDEGVNFQATKIDDKIHCPGLNSKRINRELVDKQLIPDDDDNEKRSNCGKKEILRIKKEEKAKVLTMMTTTTTTTRLTPPVPAPRTRKTNPIEHTYQNIPPPVFPEKSATACKLKVCRPLILFNTLLRVPTLANIATAKSFYLTSYLYVLSPSHFSPGRMRFSSSVGPFTRNFHVYYHH